MDQLRPDDVARPRKLCAGVIHGTPSRAVRARNHQDVTLRRFETTVGRSVAFMTTCPEMRAPVV
jgi:hypothetical protein